MDTTELQEARDRLEAFLEPLLPLFGRLERRRWGSFYVQGLLLEGGRKTAAGMATRFGGNEQALQQFVSQSPWDWIGVRKQLAAIMTGSAGTPCVWMIDDTGFPKKGSHSVGVARQYSGTLGKIGNCQIGASLSYGVDTGAFPIDFELYLPEEWINNKNRLSKAGIGDDVVFKTKWQLALDMIDRALSWGIPQGVVTADAGYGAVAAFRANLRERELLYCVGVSSQTGAWTYPVKPQVPAYQGSGRPRTRPRDVPAPMSLLDIAKQVPDDLWQDISWRQGTKGPLAGHFTALRVQPSNGHSKGKIAEPMQWLLIEWPSGAAEPTRYWLSNLPEDTAIKDLAFWAKSRWWIEQNYQQLKDDLGLDHFEGRSFTGWHHHVTLTMIAFCFLILEGIRCKKNFWVDPPKSKDRTPKSPFHEAWVLSGLR